MMGFLQSLMMFLLVGVALFLVLLILIQRGRGGGLAGAFGGMGGQSAFGTKAGDIFTRITIITAAVWIVLCATSVKVFSSKESRFSSDLGTEPGATANSSGAAGGAAIPGPGASGGDQPGTEGPASSGAAPGGSIPDAGTPSGSTPDSSDPSSAEKTSDSGGSSTAPASGEKAPAGEPTSEGK
jgi:preprotein translocase subunit SecG